MNALSGELKELSSSAATRLDFWEKFLTKIRPQSVLEVGVWKGGFAAHLLERCDSIGRYYMIDPWRKLGTWNKPLNTADSVHEEAFQATIAATRFAESKRVVLRGTTTEVIDRIPDQSLDFAYIDGDHTLRGITIDLTAVYPKIKPGGFLAGDDFVPTIWQHETRFEPTLVFPFSVYFAEAVGMPIYALPFSQFLIAKLPQQQAHSFIDLTGKYKDLGLREQMTLGRLARKRIKEALPFR
jgi:hypothetical protein